MSLLNPTVTRGQLYAVFDDWLRCAATYPPVQRMEYAFRAAFSAADLPDEAPLRDYCKAIEATGLLDKAALITVYKSNYLARRLYAGEAHRTVRCPNIPHGLQPVGGCSFCGNTGFLPAAEGT